MGLGVAASGFGDWHFKASRFWDYALWNLLSQSRFKILGFRVPEVRVLEGFLSLGHEKP